MKHVGVWAIVVAATAALTAGAAVGQDRYTLGMSGATWMLAFHAALVKGFFAEEGLTVQGAMVDTKSAVEQNKPWMQVKTDTGLAEPDFGFLDIDQLHKMAAGEIDYYIVDGNNFGCMEVMVPPDSPIKSTADLKGKRIEVNPWWFTPFRSSDGLAFVNVELKAAGLDPAKDVTLAPIPWEALPRIAEYVTEGFKSGKFDAVGLTEPHPLMLSERKLLRPVFSQTYNAPLNQEYCCLFGIRRAIVDRQPDKAALIVRAYRRAKQWVAQNPSKAVIAAQAAGYYPAGLPVEASANRVVAFGFDRQVDLAQALEGSFQERIDLGHIKTDKSAKELVRLHYRKIE